MSLRSHFSSRCPLVLSQRPPQSFRILIKIMFSRRQSTVLLSIASAFTAAQGQYAVIKKYSAAGCTGTPIETSVMSSETFIRMIVHNNMEVNDLREQMSAVVDRLPTEAEKSRGAFYLRVLDDTSQDSGFLSQAFNYRLQRMQRGQIPGEVFVSHFRELQILESYTRKVMAKPRKKKRRPGSTKARIPRPEPKKEKKEPTM